LSSAFSFSTSHKGIKSVVRHISGTLAAAQGFEEAQKVHDIVASKMTPDQIAEAQRFAREWLAIPLIKRHLVEDGTTDSDL